MPETTTAAPEPITIPCGGEKLASLLDREWLVSNRIGAYASSTIVGCNTRRYHGLLVAATTPPVGRIAALSSLMAELTVGGETFELSTFEFAGTFSPRGAEHVREFRNDAAATFVYTAGPAELVQEVVLADAANAVAVRYTLRGAAGDLRLRPFAALRDFHHLRTFDASHMLRFETDPAGLTIHDLADATGPLHIFSDRAGFEPDPQWWYHFLYRVELSRGQDAYEDLYSPGWLACRLEDGESVQVTASFGEPIAVDFDSTVAARQRRREELAGALGEDADETSRRLAIATDAFCVDRSFPNAPPSPTILAGYPWFADWGRDAFIALGGLLLTPKRFGRARGVFSTFASAISDGMIPNRFDDRSAAAHYNSIDASLWFIIAADRYVQASRDTDFWASTLLPACRAILTGYHDGTRFGIRADADGLLAGGTRDTQLTWMDAKLGDQVVTTRHGKAVEVNALWYTAHRICAERRRTGDAEFAAACASQAEMIAAAFEEAFWNADAGCLYDCIVDGEPDASIRPNQIFAVSLPYSPLGGDRQRAVVETVRDRLLTPMGLRTLSPDDRRYRRRYGGSWESRDRAYHQGTVWAWLIGPFIEAYLRVEQYKPFALAQAEQWLDGFDEHLRQAGLGQVSEIFDAEAPHTPRGCFAQAWSVAEVLRAKMLISEHLRSR